MIPKKTTFNKNNIIKGQRQTLPLFYSPDKSGIKVAKYMTELPKRELLEQKFHKAVELAQKRPEAKPAWCNTEHK
ncbi:MAG: hypothetical protein Q7J15_12620 [Candidatus Desulfaltia sp.]|nr:hypothetical protein [Candidatus Desulfaltia sp.]